jgi:glutaryl-CoA dehydrogenase
MGEMGILGPTIKGYNCLGESYKTYGLIAKEIESIDSGYRSMFSVQSSLVMNPIYHFANEKIKDKYLPLLASGKFIGCFGLTEPDSGSDASTMKTKAIKDGGNYILNGNKTWITNSPLADVFIVWAKNENNKINGFVLDREMNGITTPKIEGKLSLRASPTGMINLDDVVVPKENKLNIEGMKGPFSCLNSARLGIAFGVLGSAKSCIDKATEYSLDRQLFGESLANKQITQIKLADLVIDWNLAMLGCLHVAEKVDEKLFDPVMISVIKKNSCEKALNTARVCRDILGGNGISDDYEIMRHLTNLESVYTYEGTNDIHRLIIGNKLTGLKAF